MAEGIIPDRVVSVSVDLDAVDCYWRIHALPGAPPPGARFTILRRCLPRFADLFARHSVRATFFVVGRDLDDDAEGRAALAALARDGHELGSHSYTHPYDLVRLGRQAIEGEIDRAHAVIAACGQTPPVGFRAPGYEVSGEVIDLLCARRYRYDSSAFPSVPYYGAKAVVMAAMRVLGRRSGSTLGSPRILTAPRRPYRPAAGQPYRTGSLDIVELPIAVSPIARLPVIGTSLITAPEWLRHRMVASLLHEGFLNLELHGIDLADAAGDDIPAELVARQPDLRRPLAQKLAALDATLRQATAAGARFERLDAYAATVAPLL
ncbi:MAG TPA: polysaccharide deacetylase family protein [Polyangia bacterium]|jgi:peptidoglycan/xylan/chitin deacetylase (PgdA/CDA1 family)|nr:polysaccharide deacetylase family protein [Polyangia bacterium]